LRSADGRFRYGDRHGNPLPPTATLADAGRFFYRCRAFKRECSVNCANAGYRTPRHTWTLTGTVDKPTLSPSINCGEEGCGWHGFIESGVFLTVHRVPEARQ
jgi:hypothetical protein